MTTTRTVLTVSEAAASCLVNPKTITRKMPRLVELGAEKDITGQWRIPVEALLEVGLKPGRPKGPDPQSGQSEDFVTPDVRVELAKVTTERDMLRELVNAAERIITATEKRAETAERALLMLESGKRPADAESTVEATSTPSPAPATETAPKRHRLRDFFTGK